ncbi:hypothetical protein JKP88DRAFT_335503 [Tribonema minus]|uniref:Phospholipid/glycerol acyltransferase domain-containing protein n=1 Tax=Tribonema minus TaxID=303371 RepID=A0A835YT11_9STRA|nr:hypothetical protein JKP88DRAFT_335503 [Tribonema minus]
MLMSRRAAQVALLCTILSCTRLSALQLPRAVRLGSVQHVSHHSSFAGCSASLPLRFGLQSCWRTTNVPLRASAAAPIPDENSGATQRKWEAAAPAQQESRPVVKTGLHVNIAGRALNAYGLLYAITSTLTGLLVFPLVAVVRTLNGRWHRCTRLVDRKRLRVASWFGSVWCRLSLLSMGIRPKVEGLHNLPPPTETVVFLPNHTSFLDVPVTGFLPRLVKYLTKAELAWMPLIGWKAVLAGDILVRRADKSSFRRLIADASASLRAGNCLVAFPEGTRSRSGALAPFKKGPFLMAQKAGVRVVPISIAGVAEVMPPRALAPLSKPAVTIVIHAPVDPAVEGVEGAMRSARAAIASGLPRYEHVSGAMAATRNQLSAAAACGRGSAAAAAVPAAAAAAAAALARQARSHRIRWLALPLADVFYQMSTALTQCSTHRAKPCQGREQQGFVRACCIVATANAAALGGGSDGGGSGGIGGCSGGVCLRPCTRPRPGKYPSQQRRKSFVYRWQYGTAFAAHLTVAVPGWRQCGAVMARAATAAAMPVATA